MFKNYNSFDELFNLLSQYRSSNDPQCGLLDYLYYKILGITPKDDEKLLNLYSKHEVARIQDEYIKYSDHIEYDESKLNIIENFVAFVRNRSILDKKIKKENKYVYKKISNTYDSKYILQQIFNFYNKEKDMKNLNVIMGQTGSGKTSLEKELMHIFDKIMVTTNRESRTGEIHGITYNFVTEGDFLDKLEKSKYALEESFPTKHGDYTPRYMIEKSEFEKLKQKDCVVCLTPSWYAELKKKKEEGFFDFDFNIIPYLLYVDQESRIKKAFERDSLDFEDETNKNRLIERTENENKMFRILDNDNSVKLLKHNYEPDSMVNLVTEVVKNNFLIIQEGGLVERNKDL